MGTLFPYTKRNQRAQSVLDGHNLSGYVRVMERELDILDAIDRSGIPNRGTLKVWLTKNQDAFDERLVTRKPDWSALAEVFVKAGLLDSRGKPPTAEATRKTWYRVKGDAAKASKKPALSPAAPPLRLAIQPARQLNQTTSATQPGNASDGGLGDVLKAMDAKQGQMPKPFK